MKRNIFLLVGLIVGLLVSCKKDLTVEKPSADFIALNPREQIGDTLIYEVGDTCKFGITGYADHISFWSGMIGQRYDFRQREDSVGRIVMSFTSQAQWGSEMNTLHVFAVTNLSSLDSASVVQADWEDITDRTPLSVTGNVAVHTGDVDLTDLIKSPDDVLYVAFRYKASAPSGSKRTWTISNYRVRNVGEDFNSALGNLATDAALWTVYGNVTIPANRRWVATTSALTIVGGTQVDPANESWIVSKPMFVGRLTPEVPTATVKSLTASTDYFEYQYNSTGVYKASFAVYNNTVDDTKSAVKHFNIRIK